MKTKKAKKGFLDGYKTYNPNKEGYGSPDEWRSDFYERLGYEKAVEVLGEDDPLQILQISNINPTWDEISRAYRKLILMWHPDRNPNNEDAVKMAKRVIAAFEVLEKRYKK
jgi:DnaJ-class molecular chaperone